MNRWRHPTLSLHGIEGAYSDQGAKTVIPRQGISLTVYTVYNGIQLLANFHFGLFQVNFRIKLKRM